MKKQNGRLLTALGDGLQCLAVWYLALKLLLGELDGFASSRGWLVLAVLASGVLLALRALQNLGADLTRAPHRNAAGTLTDFFGFAASLSLGWVALEGLGVVLGRPLATPAGGFLVGLAVYALWARPAIRRRLSELKAGIAAA